MMMAILLALTLIPAAPAAPELIPTRIHTVVPKREAHLRAHVPIAPVLRRAPACRHRRLVGGTVRVCN